MIRYNLRLGLRNKDGELVWNLGRLIVIHKADDGIFARSVWSADDSIGAVTCLWQACLLAKFPRLHRVFCMDVRSHLAHSM